MYHVQKNILIVFCVLFTINCFPARCYSADFFELLRLGGDGCLVYVSPPPLFPAATAQCECPSGYTLDGGKCVKNSNEVVCDENNYATVVFNGSVVRAYCIKSKEDLNLYIY